MQLKRNSISFKLIVAFLIVLAPLYVISLNMNALGSRNVKEQIIQSMQSQNHFYLDQLSLEFYRSMNLMQQYINDDDLRELSALYEVLSPVERTEAIRRLQNKLIVLQNVSTYLSDAAAFIPSLNREISGNTFEDIDPAEWAALEQVENARDTPFLYWHHRLFISVKQPNFILAVEVAPERLAASLENANINGKAMIVSNDFQWSIANDGEAGLQQYLRGWAAERQAVNGVEAIRYQDQRYLVTYERSASSGLTLLTYVSEQDVLGPLKRYRMWFWIMSFMSCLIIVAFSYWTNRLIHLPLLMLVKGFRRMEVGDLDVRVKYRRKDEFQYLYRQFNSMIVRLKELIGEVYEQRYLVRLAELRQLQLQIKPHFLYNSLFHLYRLAKMNDLPKVVHMTKHLGDFFRLMNESADEVTLELELKYAKSYVHIQTVRFEEQIRVDFDPLPESFAKLKVPKLIIQPVIENGYNHGLEDQKEIGYIQVRIRSESESRLVVISVEDNGHGLSEQALGALQRKLHISHDIEKTGLLNVHRRLRLKYGEEAGLRLSRSDLGGLKVEIRIMEADNRVQAAAGG